MIKKLSLICLLALVGCMGKSKEKPSFLFVILSNHGELKQAANGSFELILDHGEIEKVLAFANRPYRIVRPMSAEAFEDMWGTDTNSFAENPPNATVVIDQHVQTVVLLNAKVEAGKTIFKVRSDGTAGLAEARGKTQLFVDAYSLCTTPHFMRLVPCPPIKT